MIRAVEAKPGQGMTFQSHLVVPCYTGGYVRPQRLVGHPRVVMLDRDSLCIYSPVRWLTYEVPA